MDKKNQSEAKAKPQESSSRSKEAKVVSLESEGLSKAKTSAESKDKPQAVAESKAKSSLATDKEISQAKVQQKTEKAKLLGIYAFKLKMSSLYDEKGHITPVTFLKFQPWVVSQVKTKAKEGYNSVQMASGPQKNNRVSKALKKHLAPAGFEEGACHIREIRQTQVDHIKIGQDLSIHSLKKGDRVLVQAISKGHGFAGVVKRWGFKGGPASHGSTIHRTSGSIGNRTEPARVMPGKKMAGHYGAKKVSLKNVPVVDVVEDENLIILKGPVPGARNGLVYLRLNDRAQQQRG